MLAPLAAGSFHHGYNYFFYMIEALIVLSLPVSFMPIMTGFYAYNHGRSFWRWFAIGLGLPFFSLMLVAVVVHREQCRQAQIEPRAGRPTHKALG